MFPGLPVPIRLPYGAWWLARNDALWKLIANTGFENSERRFVERFLQPGMTVLDVGAHHGYYTLLASKRVGSRGKVISFEPSPRERKALHINLRLNRCRNVVVEGIALGDQNGNSELFVSEDRASGCNSLKLPDIPVGTSRLCVQVARLDDRLVKLAVDRVDFVKLDVEGGELGVLRGATGLFEGEFRPVILAEVQDVRTLPWGYRAKEILEHLSEKGYKWFGLLEDGTPEELDLDGDDFEGNFVACPKESLGALERMRRSGTSVHSVTMS
jgi:FkbM family methyltransferase